MQWKSPAGRLERKARPRSGSPGIIAGSAAPVWIAGSIGAIDVFTIVVLVMVSVSIARAMLLTNVVAVTAQRRASSWVVLSRY